MSITRYVLVSMYSALRNIHTEQTYYIKKYISHLHVLEKVNCIKKNPSHNITFIRKLNLRDIYKTLNN